MGGLPVMLPGYGRQLVATRKGPASSLTSSLYRLPAEIVPLAGRMMIFCTRLLFSLSSPESRSGARIGKPARRCPGSRLSTATGRTSMP